jgi:bifunctional enzyme CysN/CysC
MDGALLRDAADPAQPTRELLRFLTCGSVDDGKSTLIGRLLFESGQIPEDQVAALERDSARFGTTGGALDYALLLDGLEAEREQGITIDVAYRYFSSPKRSFIVADTPGHEQYTRNMATGASNCDVAVILVDATKGLIAQTERHSRICALFGIRQVILAVNKMDLVKGDQKTFDAIRDDYMAFTADLGFSAITAIPLSARNGDNLSVRTETTPWYKGPTLLEALETAEVDGGATGRPFRMAVQYVNRPHADFRGYAGTITAGRVQAGDRIVVCPSGRQATVARIVTWDGDLATAYAGDAVTLVLDQEVDISRGDVFAHPFDRPTSADRFAARLLWMDERPLDPSRSYLVRIGAHVGPARITFAEEGVELGMNGIEDVVLALPQPIAFDAFDAEPSTGAFIIIDRETNATIGAGVGVRAVDQATNIYMVSSEVDQDERARLNGHGGAAIWMTGLSGAGKSTVAGAIEKALHARGVRTVVLDGDNLRHGLNRDLGFSAEDRAENVRRAGEVARLFHDAGVVTICALISPMRQERDAVRARFDDRVFLEVFVDAPLTVCRARDPKGLYAKAASGEIKDLTGVGSPYEPPLNPEVRLETRSLSPDQAAVKVIDELKRRGVL